MTNPTPAPDASALPSRLLNRTGIAIATGFGLGCVPVAPGTAGSLLTAALFAFLLYWLEGMARQLAYLFVLAGLIPLAWWSTKSALPNWARPDPRPIVIDEVLGQWLTYGGLILAAFVDPLWAQAVGWKSLLAGFILFRAFDVAKPFPIRRSERLPGAAGVLLDDVLAGVYAALGLLLLGWRGWLG